MFICCAFKVYLVDQESWIGIYGAWYGLIGVIQRDKKVTGPSLFHV